MDARQPHPFTRPPERTMVHNPNHPIHPPPSQQAHTQPYAGYPPTTSQPQPPVHLPYAADPYQVPRRDPFIPAGSHHVRRSSYGLHGPDGAPPNERHGAWANTGTLCGAEQVLDARCGATRELLRP
jgi:hypothetical protein